MKKASCIAVVIGMAMVSTAFAQTPASQPTPAPVAATATPADQQPTKEQMAKMFELMRVREQMAAMTKMMPTLMQKEMQDQTEQMKKSHPEMASMTEEQQQAAEKVTSEFMGKVMNLYTSDDMMADLGGIYQKHLTRSDVDGIIAFYSSPAGQHMLDMSPVIMQEYMPMVMQKTQERVKPLVDAMSKEMEAIAKPATPPAEKPATK